MRLQRALHINLESGYHRIERIETNGVLGPVDFGFREAGRNDALDRFEAGRWDAARDLWYEVRKGLDELLGDRPAPRTSVSG